MAFQEKNKVDIYEYQELFEYFLNEHNLILLYSEILDVINLVEKTLEKRF